jgi:hypothetical protein
MHELANFKIFQTVALGKIFRQNFYLVVFNFTVGWPTILVDFEGKVRKD